MKTGCLYYYFVDSEGSVASADILLVLVLLEEKGHTGFYGGKSKEQHKLEAVKPNKPVSRCRQRTSGNNTT